MTKSVAMRCRWMPDFLGFIKGNVIHIPEIKDEKDGIQLSDDWSWSYFTILILNIHMSKGRLGRNHGLKEVLLGKESKHHE